MIGLLINHGEQKELQYLVVRELEELLFDLDDQYLDEALKVSMRKRYTSLFHLLQRVASEDVCEAYIPARVIH